MKLIIAGSRDLKLPTFVILPIIDRIVRTEFPRTSEVVSGTARGADTYGEGWAALAFLPVIPFPPEYNKYPVWMAPKLRNTEMGNYAATPDPSDGGLLALWDMKSTGTLDMLKKAWDRKLKIVVADFKGNRYNGYRVGWEPR